MKPRSFFHGFGSGADYGERELKKKIANMSLKELWLFIRNVRKLYRGKK